MMTRIQKACHRGDFLDGRAFFVDQAFLGFLNAQVNMRVYMMLIHGLIFKDDFQPVKYNQSDIKTSSKQEVVSYDGIIVSGLICREKAVPQVRIVALNFKKTSLRTAISPIKSEFPRRQLPDRRDFYHLDLTSFRISYL
jgi:hypothetical protein